MKTPDRVVTELDEIRHAVMRSAVDIRDAESKAASADEDFRREWAVAYRRAEGSVKDREAVADLDTMTLRKEKNAAAIQVGYLKRRAADLETVQTNVQTQARMVDLTFRAPRVS
ncbi:hypothetical protein [Subtercola endophyticus]|uniref:hypothetical protein n=1 Tax=Subtercola endophyticus TaxID=2895559 RepID=UPI001E31E256|nr:hypothetical protein [Subtercola endophyticus]UFS58925.1 hypothetical protein LQ955_18340 [Subtercola endophyticus]